MKGFVVFTLFIFFPVTVINAGIKDIKAGFEVHSELCLSYDNTDDMYYLNTPLYGFAYFKYEKNDVNLYSRVYGYNRLFPPELYIEASSENSVIKLGLVDEYWGVSEYSSPFIGFSEKNNFLPDNIYFEGNYLPAYMFLINFTKDAFANEFVISKGGPYLYNLDIDESILGYRSSIKGDFYLFSAGFVKKIGYSDTQFFTQIKGDAGNLNQWMEVNWLYKKSDSDRWTAVFGLEKELNNNSITLELLFKTYSTFFHFSGKSLLARKSIQFNLDGFMDVNDLSTALKLWFNIYADEKSYLSIGGYLYLGQGEKIFSVKSHKFNNYNSIFIGLNFKS